MVLAPNGPHEAALATLTVCGQTITIALPVYDARFHQLVVPLGYTWDRVLHHWTRTISPLTNGRVQDRAIDLMRAILAAGWPLDCPDDLVLAMYRALPAPSMGSLSPPDDDSGCAEVR